VKPSGTGADDRTLGRRNFVFLKKVIKSDFAIRSYRLGMLPRTFSVDHYQVTAFKNRSAKL
jgi:hypothetical protein